MSPVQQAVSELVSKHGDKFSKRVVFAINKADVIAPGETEWSSLINVPSAEQKKNIIEFEKYIAEKIKRILPEWSGEIVTYSAKRRYHLDILMTAIVATVPEERRWVYGKNADVADFKELIDPKYLSYIEATMRNKSE